MDPTINLGILAHVDAGKTTVTERLLYLAGKIRSVGSVDDGSTVSDHTDVERQRGISVFSSLADIEYNGVRVNILDTPGHADFAGEVERGMLSLDAAVLIVSAVEGVQAQSERILLSLRKLSLPFLVFINKIDRAGSDTEAVTEELKRICGDVFVPLNEPLRQGEKDCGVTAPAGGDAALCEKLGETDDAMAEAFLEDRIPDRDEIDHALREAVGACRLVPVLCGSAAFGIGITELADAVKKYLPTAEKNLVDGVSGVIYKIEHDKTMGRLAHVRMFGGSLSAREQVRLISEEEAERKRPGAERDGSGETKDGEPVGRLGKISQIRRAMGGKFTDVGRVEAGDVAVLCGLSSATVGDCIGELMHSRRADLVSPFLQVGVTPADSTKLTALVGALGELSAEEPYLRCRWEKSDREVVIRITGEIQLEILRVLLKERYGLDAVFSPPRVVYRETPLSAAEGFEAYTMPKPCWAVVRLLLEPGERGSGVVFDRGNVPNNQLFYRYQAHVEQSFYSVIEQGIYGWEVTDFRCTLVGGEHHTIHTHPLDFFVATPVAFLRGLTNAGSGLLEPYLNVRISAPENFMGRIVSDITKMRGSFESPTLSGGKVTVEASLPVADSLSYPITLASETSGKGTIYSSFGGFYPCPEGFVSTCPRRGPDPLDRAKWILYKRGAMTEQ